METNGQKSNVGFAKGIGMGVVASLVGTIMMDVVIVLEYTLMGMPALTYLALIGSVFGRGIPVGTLAHVVLGAGLGVLFSLPMLTIDALRIDTMRKGLTLGVVVGLASIVACVPFAILIHERIATALAFMFVPHLVWGLGLGLVAGYGMQTAPAAVRPEHAA